MAADAFNMNAKRLVKPCLLASALAVLSVGCFAAQHITKVPRGSKIYIHASDGFDTYLAAALEKKKVPVVVVVNKAEADYELDGVSDHVKAGWAKEIFLGQIHSNDAATIRLVNLKTGEVVFAYAVNKKNTLHGQQTAAEACAKHLKKVVSKD
ncbi:MAG TPA: hypothetical protein VFW94_22605 [Candidatus Acidoferrales bacterium]|nr:hypothetical protein [Candidatus Acidoferrales bacterium]